MAVTFSRAIKYEAKGRVALIGPAGSGKSYTMLTLARLLAGEGKIAAIDTEQGSLSKYADLFDFDVCPLKSYSPDTFMDALRQAERDKYAVFCCDSLSHFWMGKDGALEFVDNAAKRSQSRDGMAGWKDFRPHERQMIDAMISSPMHVICTMRTKTDYQDVEVNGKKKRIKVGLAPVQRDGLEYEFDLVGLMDDDNTFIIDKTRCPALSGRAMPKPKDEDFQVFADWLKGAAKPEPPKPAARTQATAQTTERPQAARQQPAAATPAYPDPVLDRNQLEATILSVETRETRAEPKKPFYAVKIAGKVDGGSLIYCWHLSLGDAVEKTVGQRCLFEVQKTANYLNIEDVIAIGSQEYRDGIPYNVDNEPATRTQVNPEITDDDIPF